MTFSYVCQAFATTLRRAIDVKKPFLRFLFWSRFLRFLFSKRFLFFKKRWQSSERQAVGNV